MSTQNATVESDGYTITSTSESAEDMIAALTPKTESPEPREVKSEKPDPEQEEAERVSKAAAELGKKGGEAAAAKRAEAKEEAEKAEALAEAEEKPEEKVKAKSRAQLRVEESTREAAEVKRQLAAERQERERLAAEVEKLRSGKAEEPKAKVDEDPEPKEEDFENYADFVKAGARWAARQEYAQSQRKAKDEQESNDRLRTVHEATRTFFGRLSKAAETDPGFKNRTGEFIGSLQPSFLIPEGQRRQAFNVVADELFASEQAPALIAHFVEHPEDFDRITNLPNSPAVIRAMAKLEDRLEGATSGNPPPDDPQASKPGVSKANPPGRPVPTGTPHTADTEPGDDASYDEHARYWNAKEKRRR